MGESYVTERDQRYAAAFGRSMNEWERQGQLMQDVDRLLGALYCPVRSGWAVDRDRAREAGVWGEPVNWGDLGATDVKRVDGRLVVYVEEASPEATGLRAYLLRWLTAWGWADVDVVTEW